ncbi:MAG: molybdopterin-binding protein [Chloroflexi bacterium]|nr:molybdopterin-binding protein [Chloroflexota bacterium]
MAEMFTVLTPQDALRRLLEHLDSCPTPTETLPLMESVGRILAEEIASPADLPPFARSSMDGYAVRAQDTFGASEGNPVYLSVVGEVMMGEEATIPLGQDQAVRISTGGMRPIGADAVVIVEDTQLVAADMVEVRRAVAPEDNVAQVGEDIRKGEILLTRGHRLRPWDLGALAGVGLSQVRVFRRPRVAIIATGDELIEPGKEPQPGQISDINSYTLAALVTEAGGIALRQGIVGDDYTTLRAKAEYVLATADMLLLSGGSSVGTRDLTSRVMSDLGEPGIIVHGVAVRPGKPTILAVAKGTPIFGLPGQPVSTIVIFDLLVKPVIQQLAGYQVRLQERVWLRAYMARNVASAPGREEYIRVRLENRDGELWAVPILGKSSSISTMIRADGLAIIPLNKEGVEMGEAVEVRLL